MYLSRYRLWSHRTYKARLPLRVFLVFCNSMAGQNSVYTWSRDHRTHHKHSETDADPHNSKRWKETYSDKIDNILFN